MQQSSVLNYIHPVKQRLHVFLHAAGKCCNHGKLVQLWCRIKSRYKDPNVLQFKVTVMTKPENTINYPNHHINVTRAFCKWPDHWAVAGQMSDGNHCIPCEWKVKVSKNSMVWGALSFLFSNHNFDLIFASPASFRYIFVLISEHLSEAERSTLSKSEAETRPCFGMVSDCIHHTAAGTEFSHASMSCVQEDVMR